MCRNAYDFCIHVYTVACVSAFQLMFSDGWIIDLSMRSFSVAGRNLPMQQDHTICPISVCTHAPHTMYNGLAD